MCSGGVTVTIIGVDVDAAMELIVTLFNRSNSTGSGVSGTCTFLYNEFTSLYSVRIYIYK